MEENAERVIEAVQEEWQKRLKLYQKGGYKADTLIKVFKNSWI